jgi:hypothetical protein
MVGSHRRDHEKLTGGRRDPIRSIANLHERVCHNDQRYREGQKAFSARNSFLITNSDDSNRTFPGRSSAFFSDAHFMPGIYATEEPLVNTCMSNPPL